MKKYKFDAIVKKLKLYIVEHHDTQKAAAEAWGMEPTYISAMKKGTRPIPGWLLKKIGFERVKDEYYIKLK